MAINNAFTAFVKIFYQSNFGPHVMERPVRSWVGTPWTGAGTFVGWDEGVVPADDMIEELITLMLPLFTAAVSFGSYIIYVKQEDDDPGDPVFAKNLTGQTGSSTSTAQIAAYAKTYTYLTASSHSAKLVLLDVPTGGVVSKFNSLAPGDELDMVNALSNPANAWCGRDNTQIVVWRSGSNDVNDALQKKYRI